jgi:hypothetical protein
VTSSFVYISAEEYDGGLQWKVEESGKIAMPRFSGQ